MSRLPATLLLLGAASILHARPERKLTLATWYGKTYQGRSTASGKPFDPQAFTAAHPGFPFGTRLRLSWLDRSVIVTVNDRGPEHGGLDLSEAAFKALAPLEIGTLHVAVEVLP